MVDEAKREAAKMQAALAPYAERGIPIVGLEPSCRFSLRDEYPARDSASWPAAPCYSRSFSPDEAGQPKLKG